MTNGQTNFILAIAGLISLGTAMLFWDMYRPALTPEQQKSQLYALCVRVRISNGKLLEDCNNIE